jgi:hypothetical protein
MQPGAELLGAPADNVLLAHLRDDQNRHAMIEALAHAVHAAVAHEGRRAPEHLELRHVTHNQHVWRRLAERVEPDLLPH